MSSNSSHRRRRNIRFVAYNTRFLILPWVKAPHLASHLLGRMAARLSADWEQAYCIAQGRRQFVDVAENFPEQCRYVLEMLGEVYGHDAKAREAKMEPEQRLQFHIEHSGPVMTKLHQWLEAHFAERKRSAEPDEA